MFPSCLCAIHANLSLPSPLNAARLCVRSLASEGFYVTQCTFICVHAGLKGQLWFWVLLGKTTILLLSLASLAVKHKTE